MHLPLSVLIATIFSFLVLYLSIRFLAPWPFMGWAFMEDIDPADIDAVEEAAFDHPPPAWVVGPLGEPRSFRGVLGRTRVYQNGLEAYFGTLSEYEGNPALALLEMDRAGLHTIVSLEREFVPFERVAAVSTVTFTLKPANVLGRRGPVSGLQVETKDLRVAVVCSGRHLRGVVPVLSTAMGERWGEVYLDEGLQAGIRTKLTGPRNRVRMDFIRGGLYMPRVLRHRAMPSPRGTPPSAGVVRAPPSYGGMTGPASQPRGGPWAAAAAPAPGGAGPPPPPSPAAQEGPMALVLRLLGEHGEDGDMDEEEDEDGDDDDDGRGLLGLLD